MVFQILLMLRQLVISVEPLANVRTENFLYLAEPDSMPRYIPNKVITDCWSSAGSVTFFHINGVCYYKNRGNNIFQESELQLEHLELQRRALAAWRSLPFETQLIWNELALPVTSHRPPFDGSTHISGCNLFTSAYRRSPS